MEPAVFLQGWGAPCLVHVPSHTPKLISPEMACAPNTLEWNDLHVRCNDQCNVLLKYQRFTFCFAFSSVTTITAAAGKITETEDTETITTTTTEAATETTTTGIPLAGFVLRAGAYFQCSGSFSSW